MDEGLYTKDCVRTKSGVYVNVIDPDPNTLHLGDIAHALGKVQRFGGHLPVGWSVAQHSLLVASMAPEGMQLEALLHDASEAFLCDIPAPLKAHLPDYRAIEERMMLAIAKRFGMQWPLPPGVKAADARALNVEWDLLMCGNGWELSTPYLALQQLTRFPEGGSHVWERMVEGELRKRNTT